VIEYDSDFSRTVSPVHPQDLQNFFIFLPMYLLSCPNCQADISVTPAQAGDSLQCAQCQSQVAIPNLGELRKLPQTAESSTQATSASRPVGATIAFVVLSLIAVAALLGAGYNGIRWALIDAEITTETHLADIEEDYSKEEPAVMIVAFEDMEKDPLDLMLPYPYRQKVVEKSKWGWNAAIAAGLALACGTGAFIAASQSHRD
jgi:hypothetical protein